MRFHIDAVGNFTPFGGENHELFGLAVGVDEHIGYIRNNVCYHPAVNHKRHTHLKTFYESAFKREQYGRGHDQHIHNDHRASDAYVAHFGYHSRYDVRATRRAVVYESGSYPHSAQNAAEDDTHGYVGYQRVVKAHEEAFKDADGKSGSRGTEDCAQDKRLADYLEGHRKQKKVARILGYGNRNQAARGEIHECAYTGQTADDYFMRENESAETDSIKNHAENNHNIVFGIGHQ